MELKIPESYVPTYKKVASDLVKKIEAGETTVGEKFPPEIEFARQLNISVGTLRKALDILSYNSLVRSWPEISRLARESGRSRLTQTTMFDENKE